MSAFSRGNDITLGSIANSSADLSLPRHFRDKHLYVCGATGTGKSKFLENLIRQDIKAWFKSRCGLLLLDPHGSLYDSLLAWLTRSGVTRLPIIPIDLRNSDWVVSYNALRKREVSDCSVIIDNFVNAMAHVWGATGTDHTPRFARWATNILRTLYENDLTLLEAEYLIDHLDREARSAMAQKVTDRASKRDWLFANDLKPREFEAELGSTSNRLHRFLRNAHMRNVFGQSKVSLDLRKALDEGHIILVSLATAGAQVSEEDSDLFATMLLSDLWTAALERGKKPCVKPFYLYLDEFQRFVTPTIARNLDEARGFGLHLTMAHQFPQQLLDQGEQGKKLYHSIMENASSKVVFRLQSDENLRPLAEWLFRGVINPDEVKHTLETTKVMAYDEATRVSRTRGMTLTRSVTEAESESEVSSHGTGATSNGGASITRPEDLYGQELSEEVTATYSAGQSHSESSLDATGRQKSISVAESVGHSASETENSVLIPVLGKELSAVQFRSIDEQLHQAMSALFAQKERHGIARLVGMKAPVSIRTPDVLDKPVSPERIRKFIGRLLEKWPFAMPYARAHEERELRERQVEAMLRQSLSAGEPSTARRRISSDTLKE